MQAVREQTDAGRPTVVAEPDSEAAEIYLDMARRTAGSLARVLGAGAPTPTISFEDN